MQFSEFKSAFMKAAVHQGYRQLEEVPDAYKVDVPVKLLNRWMKQLTHVTYINHIPENPRLINGFSLGADPELSFMYQGAYKSAMDFGLQTGLAFGIDMNGRLAEFRPHPSRFALDIVASLLTELRWMAIFHPQTLSYDWVSTPFNEQDGLGGHVHFARKRKEDVISKEITVFDCLHTILDTVGVFDKTLDGYRRTKTKYGRARDYRLQRHGYEYRSFPTWLDSPWLAYFVLVISKLSLIDPNIIKSLYNYNKAPQQLVRSLHNLLAYYKHVDDDAWIACNAFERWGLPKQVMGFNDIKNNWGINYPKDYKFANKPMYYPGMIKASKQDREDIFRFLVDGYTIPSREPDCTWNPNNVSNSYRWLPTYSSTYHRVGIGELISDLVSHKDFTVNVGVTESPYVVMESDCNRLKLGLDAFKGVMGNKIEGYFKPSSGKGASILLPSFMRSNEMIPQVKKILTSGILPLWTVNDVREDSYKIWCETYKEKDAPKYVGKELSL